MSAWGLTIQRGPWKETVSDRRGAYSSRSSRNSIASPRNTYRPYIVRGASNAISKVPNIVVQDPPAFYHDVNAKPYGNYRIGTSAIRRDYESSGEPPKSSFNHAHQHPVFNNPHVENFMYQPSMLDEEEMMEKDTIMPTVDFAAKAAGDAIQQALNEIKQEEQNLQTVKMEEVNEVAENQYAAFEDDKKQIIMQHSAEVQAKEEALASIKNQLLETQAELNGETVYAEELKKEIESYKQKIKDVEKKAFARINQLQSDVVESEEKRKGAESLLAQTKEAMSIQGIKVQELETVLENKLK